MTSREPTPRKKFPKARDRYGTSLLRSEVVIRFRYDRRLQKAISIPYSKLLSNYDALVERLKDSDFSALVPTLR